jgi:preprotein translocase subunit YajC
MLLILVAVMYFFMIRPERKRKKEAEELRNSLAVGDPIVTIGGLTGRIVEISEENIVFETSDDRVRIEVKKWAINKKSK